MLQKAFGLPIGFSDHSIGFSIPLASVALGACIIEKHFTTDKNLPGWDHEISADPKELAVICEEGKNISTSLGVFKRVVSEAEQQKKAKFRRSIVINKDLKAGHMLTPEDLTNKRPGTGISPDLIDSVTGRILVADKENDTLLKWTDLK
jgi:N-acetylneuraminate synthase